ncbi:hypothetical protein N866_01190 [Actinotalea ferrariae CF5-4]|uniref:Uncharacterized protein n=1 Tax=Actinotalea ferrariae CF5-4 TaxID=948458 RepID=A0A021VTL1_9CELL|nr:hypothetical protein [Actinotalea ferrariae]EYR63365.1 hypothetical protein N866_01190 [Actinotalea ferrariae CF5-4]
MPVLTPRPRRDRPAGTDRTAQRVARRTTLPAPRRRLLAVLTALLTVVLGAPAAAATAPAEEPTADQSAGGPVVLVGMTGVRWDDVRTLATPVLWELSRSAGLGTVSPRSLRSFSCPADGWLAVSAGARAGDLPGEGYGECRALRPAGADGRVPGWTDYEESAAGSSFSPTLGLLGELLVEHDVPAAGFGPGASIALADADGDVIGTHERLPGDPDALRSAVAEALTTSRLVVVDAGTVRDTGRATVPRAEPDPAAPEEGEGAGEGTDPDQAPAPLPDDGEPAGPDVITEPTRLQQLQPVDARLGAVLRAAAEHGEDVTVLVVSLADSGTVARMQLAAALGPAPSGPTYDESILTTRSTRQDGILQVTDVTPTLLALLGLQGEAPAGALVGSPVRPTPGPASAIDRLAYVVDIDRHQVASRPVVPTTYTYLIVVNLLLQAVVVVGLNGRFMAATSRFAARLRDRAASGLSPTRPTVAVPVLRGLVVAGVAVGSLPVAATLANLVPWWRAGSPGWAVTAVIGLWIAALTAVALLPPVRRRLLGPMAVVGWATALVLVADVVTGATVQLSAPLGVSTVVGARFYGFNNTSFAVFAAAVLLAAATVADPLVRSGRRRTAALVVGGIGLVAAVVNGTPGLGSDFGGPPALLPGFAVLALAAAGIRLTWRRAVVVLGGTGAAMLAFLLVDWLRPPEDRTHLGRFVDTVLDGGLGDVVGRKLAQNVANLGGTWLTLLAVGGIALVVVVLLRPLRQAASAPDGGAYGWLSSGEPLTALTTAAPMLRPVVWALAVTLGIGFLVNDSGIVIPAMGVSVAVPLLVAVSASWLLRVRGDAPVLSRPGRAPSARVGR